MCLLSVMLRHSSEQGEANWVVQEDLALPSPPIIQVSLWKFNKYDFF